MDTNICSFFLATATRLSQQPAIIYKNATWIKNTWSDYRLKVACLAKYLSEKVAKGDKVAIMSETRYEWALCDFASLFAGAVSVPVYASNTADDLAYILNDSQVKILFIDSQENYEKWLEVQDKCPSVEAVISFFVNDKNSECLFFQDVLKQGFHEDVIEDLEKYASRISLDDLATIVYTSGTTGKPKGVVLSHEQIVSEVKDIFALCNIGEQDTSLSFLPFAHIMGRIEIWGQAYAGFTMGYAENIDSLRSNFLKIRPTFIVCVPRIFEKIYNGVISQVEASPIRMKLFKWALEVGQAVSQKTMQKERLPIDLLAKYKIAYRLVFGKLIEKMGGRIRYAISGGAPLSKEIAEFFHASGLLVLEGYGLTETTGGISFNRPHEYRFGTVGKPIGDVEIRFSEDGEILVKSKKVMKGYHNNSEASDEILKDDWLHTGDIGTLTHDGFLKITDRKKDLIKTTGGKYIAPQKIENLLKLNKYISNVLIHGDRKKYIVCLITINKENLKDHLLEKGVSFTSDASLHNHPEVQKLIHEAVSEVNQGLASFETIKQFAILPNDFTIESGELTPSMKVRRKYCDEKYAAVIDDLYGVDSGAI